MIDAGQVVRGLFLGNRLTLTTAADLLELNMHFLKNEVKNYQVETQEIGAGTHLVDPVFIEQGVVIGASCEIGPGVYIEHDVQIGDYAQLKNVVILRGAVIPGKVELEGQVIL